MTDAVRCTAGDWVEVERVLLEPADRSKNLPPETADKPLRMWIKGFAQAAGPLGDVMTVETMTGRLVEGTLSAINPGYFHTFGKPILERSLTPKDSMLYAFKVGILAFDATRLCAADVDFPMDVLLYTRGSFEIVEKRYERDDLRAISDWWQERMRNAVHDLPSQYIEAAFPACVSP